jgi:hypothetical protein
MTASVCTPKLGPFHACDRRLKLQKSPDFFVGFFFLEVRARILSRSRKAAPYSVGSFVISKSFISAATRNCPAFLIASIRFDPGGSFLAFSSASEALASQSCRSTLPCVSSILFSLLRRAQFAGKPTAHAGLHRVACDNQRVNVSAFLAFEGSTVGAGRPCLHF